MTGPDARAGLAVRFRRHWEARDWTRAGDRLAVACSGGLDSLVLLHLLRFALRVPAPGLRVAHFDHRMRAGSVGDRAWVAGLARAWALPFHWERAGEVPGSEEEARSLRYGFLEGLLAAGGAEWVLTAHHADDQVETVLFRILRGTGPRGLAGIPESREPGILRPLLPFARSELEAYAVRHRLRPRVDPTNDSDRHSRNRIRRRLLPELEAVHPGARRGLLRLARNASRERAALDHLLDRELAELATVDVADVAVDRSALLRFPRPLRSALLRRLAESLGGSLSEAGTASAVEFITGKASGARLDLAGPLRLEREFDRIRMYRPAPDSGPDAPSDGEDALVIEAPSAGGGEIDLSGTRFELRWRTGRAPSSALLRAGPARGRSRVWESACFDPARLAFPLRVRSWLPGDRIRIRGRSRRLAKLFREARIPRRERGRRPVLVDAGGRVLWLPGQAVWEAAEEPEDKEAPHWWIGVRRTGAGRAEPPCGSCAGRQP